MLRPGERWGYLTDLDKETMSDHVDALARRIAGWLSEAIALCKASINNAELPRRGTLEEAYLFQQTLRTEG